MTREYTHQELGREVALPAGYYQLLKELRLKQAGGEVLCVTGIGVVECSCCAGESIVAGRGGPYAFVPGYVAAWRYRVNDAGLPVSLVEPIQEDATRRKIASFIRESEGIHNIEFWEEVN